VAPSTAIAIQGGALAAEAITEPNASTAIIIQGQPEASKAMSGPKTSKAKPSVAIRAASIQAITIHHHLSHRQVAPSTATTIAKAHHPFTNQDGYIAAAKPTTTI